MNLIRPSHPVKDIDETLEHHCRILKNESLDLELRRLAACEILYHFNCQVPLNTIPSTNKPLRVRVPDPSIAIEDALDFLLDPNSDPQLVERSRGIPMIPVNGGWRAVCTKRIVQSLDLRQVQVSVEIWRLERNGKVGEVIICNAGNGWYPWNYGLMPKWDPDSALAVDPELLDPGATLAQLRTTQVSLQKSSPDFFQFAQLATLYSD